MATHTSYKTRKLQTRHARVRARVSGTTERPRLAVYKSNTQIIAQVIDDTTSKTIAHVESKRVSGKTPLERAQESGKVIAKAAQEHGVTKVVFDRGGFTYTGTIKAFADAARAAGLNF